ncbi:calmodulin [Naegleria gruberi]|uniref:Calmodulin n=1 Tax=Naegleria gruberi TaxID=5762 RepID=D2VL78_NAEGR|nr:calmodulin [Naegleria gruberi]EFC42424.1 calmodulin [Naegleria gruberi]|eukprot:XP_002675168.1 calmodulin [Naegleria gruberi]
MTSTDIQSLFHRIGLKVTSDQIREIIKGAHESYYRKSDNSLPNDSINFNEFVHLINDKPPANVSREQLITAFKILSENEEGETEGYMSVDELERYLTHFHYCTEKHFEEEQEMNDEDAEYLENSNVNTSLNLKQVKKARNFLTDPQYDMRPFTKKDFHKLVDILDPYCSGHINYLKYVSMMYDGLIQGEEISESNNNNTNNNTNNTNNTNIHHHHNHNGK